MPEASFFDLNTHGWGGYDMYRVPGLVVTGEGDILAYYEGRAQDNSQRVLLARRSTDKGKTFAMPYLLKGVRPRAMVHNPLMLAGADNQVFFFWNEDYLRLYMQKSPNGGRNWEDAVELTGTVNGWSSDWPLTLFAVAPGHGLRMKNGTLVVPMWLSRGVNAHKPACFATLYSTDNGANWQRSNLVHTNEEVVDPTEGSVAELPDGSLLATVRHGAQDTRRRAFVHGSADCWGEAYLDRSLPDPICAGGILSLPDGKLLLSNCAWGDEPCLAARRTGQDIPWSPDARQRLTVRFSGNDGRTWSGGSELTFEGGYSDLAASPDGAWVYCLYERGWIDGNCIFNEHLAFARFSPDWVK